MRRALGNKQWHRNRERFRDAFEFCENCIGAGIYSTDRRFRLLRWYKKMYEGWNS